MLLVGCFTYQQRACVSQGRICPDICTCCHTEIEAVDQTWYFTQSQYTDTVPTIPNADPVTPGAWQGIQWGTGFEVTDRSLPGKPAPQVKRGIELRSAALQADALPTGQRGG